MLLNIDLPSELEWHTMISHQLNEFSKQIARQFNVSFADMMTKVICYKQLCLLLGII